VARDARAEYKQVTVLFADVVHSMDIAAVVGAERLREIMAQLVDRAAAVVIRYGGTVNQFTGDGIMAVFGAPVALEDHAVRACLAALGIQQQTKRLAVQVREHDGVDLRLRVGLNSGEVITGEMGSGPFGYIPVGEQVGAAQRMESVAEAGGVMLSQSTARLVQDAATLDESELVHIKGADDAVTAYRLLGMKERRYVVEHVEPNLVGRQWEMSAVEGLLARAIDGDGTVVCVVGSPGIGKSRLVREVAAKATARDVQVFTAFCESHASDIAFRVVARLLRAALEVAGLDAAAARAEVRARVPDAEPEDLVLVDDLLGIADPEVPLPKIDPDARRRRLTALVNAAWLSRQAPAVFVVEDVHWIDAVSESMIADFVAVINQTRSLMLISYRPEYQGVLSRVLGAHRIALAPLSDPETAVLVTELLGRDPSVTGLATIIAERAGGNPFFAEEMVRELAERHVLHGSRGAYISAVGAAEVSVPATVQATIAARIDRLDSAAKRTLRAAAVIGARFDPSLLETLGVDPRIEDLVAAELIDQAGVAQAGQYVFRHPLIRQVAYDSQLKSDRSELHRRLAAAIEARARNAADVNSALIAEHLEAAGDAHAAYGWHMRAAAWATNRDINAARVSWERARRIADALPARDQGRAPMRIAPRTMLCGIGWRTHENVIGDRFEELRQLCGAAGDKASLAIGTEGLVMDHVFRARVREASQLASEAMALIESIGDPTLLVALSTATIFAKIENAAWSDALRWSQQVIDLADGDPYKGNLIFGSPLAIALATRATAGYCLGRSGWQDDQQQSLAMARNADSTSYAIVVTYAYLAGIAFGVLRPDDSAMREITAALHKAERSGDDLALGLVRVTLGVALVQSEVAAERDRGLKLLAKVREMFVRQAQNLGELPLIDVYSARDMARRGDHNDAIALLRAATDQLAHQGQLLSWGVPAIGVLVETLLDRGGDGDVAEAAGAIQRLATAQPDEPHVPRDIWLLRLRALLARARGDEATYAQLRDCYRDMAKAIDFQAHIEWSDVMP
jgi:class 3 adenylate cyclase